MTRHLTSLVLTAALLVGCWKSAPESVPVARQAPPSGFWGPCSGGTDTYRVSYSYDGLGRLKQIRDDEGGLEFTTHDTGFVVAVRSLSSDEPHLKLHARPLAESRFVGWLDQHTPQERAGNVSDARKVAAGVCPSEQTLLLLYPFFASPRSYLQGRNYVAAALSHTIHIVDDTVYESDSIYEGLTGVVAHEGGVTFSYDTDSTYVSYAFDSDGCITAANRSHYSGKYSDSSFVRYDKGRMVEFSTAPSFMVEATQTPLRYNASGDLVGLDDAVTFQYRCPGNVTNVVPAR